MRRRRHGTAAAAGSPPTISADAAEDRSTLLSTPMAAAVARDARVRFDERREHRQQKRGEREAAHERGDTDD